MLCNIDFYSNIYSCKTHLIYIHHVHTPQRPNINLDPPHTHLPLMCSSRRIVALNGYVHVLVGQLDIGLYILITYIYSVYIYTDCLYRLRYTRVY